MSKLQDMSPADRTMFILENMVNPTVAGNVDIFLMEALPNPCKPRQEADMKMALSVGMLIVLEAMSMVKTRDSFDKMLDDIHKIADPHKERYVKMVSDRATHAKR